MCDAILACWITMTQKLGDMKPEKEMKIRTARMRRRAMAVIGADLFLDLRYGPTHLTSTAVAGLFHLTKAQKLHTISHL